MMVTKDVLVGDREVVVVVDVDNGAVALGTIAVREVGNDGLRDVDRCVDKVVVD